MSLAAALPASLLAAVGLAGGLVAGLWPPEHGPVAVLADDFAAAVAAVDAAGGAVTAGAPALPGLVLATPFDPADTRFAERLRAAGVLAVLDPAGLAGCTVPLP